LERRAAAPRQDAPARAGGERGWTTTVTLTLKDVDAPSDVRVLLK
jgi:hypothetical protein